MIATPTALLVALGVVLSAGASATRFRPGQFFPWGGRPGSWQGGHGFPTPARTTPAVTPAAATTANPNCTLIVPADPLSAAGLATPYQLTATDPAGGPCHEANKAQAAFVQGAIISPSGQLTLYDPLVIDQGSAPAAPPAPADVPAGATVAVWFGFNGTDLTLASAPGTPALQQGNCVNGLQGSVFGQFASCNAQTFFASAHAAIANGRLQVPAPGTANDGLPCPTVRDFSVVDQDQSDNVTTHYLVNANGQTAQNNAAGRAAVPNGVDLANGSDNLLLNTFILPALGCAPFARPNGADDGAATSSLPLDELQAAVTPAAPVALVPQSDPMVQVQAAANVVKMNLYRAQVDQPASWSAPVGPVTADDLSGSPRRYCANLFDSATGIVRVFNDAAVLSRAASPSPAKAKNLFTFLAMRGNESFTALNCGKLLHQADPIGLTKAGDTVTGASLSPAAGTPAAATFRPSTLAPRGSTTARRTTTRATSSPKARTSPTPTATGTASSGTGTSGAGTSSASLPSASPGCVPVWRAGAWWWRCNPGKG